MGGLPLGVVLISGEKEESITKAFELLMEILSSNSFFKSGKKGPSIVMRDDDNTEKQALKAIWPNAIQLFGEEDNHDIYFMLQCLNFRMKPSILT